MKITETKVKVSDLVENYSDDGDGGVYGYNKQLTVRPSFQREFIYREEQRAAVIDSVLQGFPLNIMYWSKTGPDTYEVLDGQQRTISIAQYVNKDFPVKINGNDKFFQNLTDEEKQTILDYELTVNVCEGSEAEKLEWFKRINIAGAVLTPQELLNATYTGPWLADAKNYFSKRNCVAAKMAEGYLKGNPIRQELLEKALAWIADRDGLESGQMYMAIHQHDADANDLWLYFQSVINWAKMLFASKRKGITDAQAWGSFSLTVLGVMKSICPFARSLSHRSFAPMSGKGISVPCALQMESIPSTPLRIWKVTTSFLGVRADIPQMTTCRCCARNVIRRSQIIESYNKQRLLKI